MSTVVAVVLAAAALHACWNAVLHAIGDRPVGLLLYAAGGALACLVLIPLVGAPARAAWLFLAVSSVLHVGYQVFLVGAYRSGDFGQVYPLARGTAPLLVALVAATVLHERLSPGTLVGVLVITVGLGTLVLSGGRPSRSALPALGSAVLTGVFIAGYTVVDGVGVRRAAGSVGYLAWLMLLSSLLTPVAVLCYRPLPTRARLRAHLLPGLLAGVLSVLAYGLVLFAQTRGELATVSALRETSVVIGAVIGTVVFKETFGRVRVVATVLVVAGIALIELF